MSVVGEQIALGHAEHYGCNCSGAEGHQGKHMQAPYRTAGAILILPGEVKRDKKPVFFGLGRFVTDRA